MNIQLSPHEDIIVARLVDMQSTESGLVLPDSKIQGVSVFAHVESVGPKVTRCKPGDVILPRAVGHVWLRGGLFHRCTIEEKDVQCTVHGLDPSQIKYLDERRTNGNSMIAPAVRA